MCSQNSVANAVSVQASSSTSISAMNLQKSATWTEEGFSRDEIVDRPVGLSENAFENNPRENALHPSDGNIVAVIDRCGNDTARSGRGKMLTKVLKLKKKTQLDATERREQFRYKSGCKRILRQIIDKSLIWYRFVKRCRVLLEWRGKHYVGQSIYPVDQDHMWGVADPSEYAR